VTADLRLGRWEDVLADVEMVDAVITDPPYSARTHDGHDDGAKLANKKARGHRRSDGKVDAYRPRREISYTAWTAENVEAFVASWAPRNRGWFVCLSDSELCTPWRASFERHGLTGFQPVPCVIPGMTVRMSGDGPSSWAFYANVARPKALHRWGTLPGAYGVGVGVNLCGSQGEREHIGGKPEWLMRALIRDYTRPGNLVCDPCAGGGTTLVAAAIEGRRAIGSEVDAAANAKAMKRLDRGYTPDLFAALGGAA
jgi:site-specific DNA-methyltransferase (adenine-specific)